MAYVEPAPADLKIRYSAFAAVDDAVITYWLADAHRYVDTSWPEIEYGPGLIAAAAHYMAREKVAGIATDTTSDAAASGLTRWKSGTADLQFSETAVQRDAAGGWESTRYGQDYLDALDRSKGGPLVTSPGRVPWGYGYPYVGGDLGPY